MKILSRKNYEFLLDALEDHRNEIIDLRQKVDAIADYHGLSIFRDENKSSWQVDKKGKPIK